MITDNEIRDKILAEVEADGCFCPGLDKLREAFGGQTVGEKRIAAVRNQLVEEGRLAHDAGSNRYRTPGGGSQYDRRRREETARGMRMVREYIEACTPDKHGRLPSNRIIAAELNLPSRVVWRGMQALVADGVVTRKGSYTYPAPPKDENGAPLPDAEEMPHPCSHYLWKVAPDLDGIHPFFIIGHAIPDFSAHRYTPRRRFWTIEEEAAA